MKILAIDTSTTLASVAYYNDNQIITKSINNEVTHSEKLLVIIDELLKENNIKLNEVELFASTYGPGSFTGLRIGIATIKAFAHVNNIKIYGKSTLDVLAVPAFSSSDYVCSMLDAKNNNVYYSLYTLKNNNFIQIILPKFSNIQEALEDIQKIIPINKVSFIGNGAVINKEKITNLEQDSKIITDSSLPEAKSLITLANMEKDLVNCKNIYEYNDFKPIYLRLSQAERSSN